MADFRWWWAGTTLAAWLVVPDLEDPNMIASPITSPALLKTRNKAVAKSFYRQLRTEGFSHEEIIQLSTTLLGLVTDDLDAPQARQA